ncbi:MAG TPA: hypothetical protein PLA79_01465 [Bacteroidales bacterium]|nr:hypothetical protein [Bacteroidales bacterium]
MRGLLITGVNIFLGIGAFIPKNEHLKAKNINTREELNPRNNGSLLSIPGPGINGS